MSNEYEIKSVKRYQTFDGRLFKEYEEAVKHTTLSIKVKDILKLLGGDNSDICPDSCNFSNGDGYYIIDEDNHKKALELVEIIKKEFEIENYHSESRMCHEHNYFKSISYTLSCITKKGNKIIRVGQPYYKNHLDQLGNKVYN